MGSHEIALGDAVRLASRAAADDVHVEFQVWPQVPHVFQSFSVRLDEADEALQSAAAFTRDHWAAAQAPAEAAPEASLRS